jgi:hypothetical protein
LPAVANVSPGSVRGRFRMHRAIFGTRSKIARPVARAARYLSWKKSTNERRTLKKERFTSSRT